MRTRSEFSKTSKGDTDLTADVAAGCVLKCGGSTDVGEFSSVACKRFFPTKPWFLEKSALIADGPRAPLLLNMPLQRIS